MARNESNFTPLSKLQLPNGDFVGDIIPEQVPVDMLEFSPGRLKNLTYPAGFMPDVPILWTNDVPHSDTQLIRPSMEVPIEITDPVTYEMSNTFTGRGLVEATTRKHLELTIHTGALLRSIQRQGPDIATLRRLSEDRESPAPNTLYKPSQWAGALNKGIISAVRKAHFDNLIKEFYKPETFGPYTTALTATAIVAEHQGVGAGFATYAGLRVVLDRVNAHLLRKELNYPEPKESAPHHVVHQEPVDHAVEDSKENPDMTETIEQMIPYVGGDISYIDHGIVFRTLAPSLGPKALRYLGMYAATMVAKGPGRIVRVCPPRQ